MKKLILGLLLIGAVSVNVNAQTQSRPVEEAQRQVQYTYYPQQNIYYNDVSKDYWYYDKPTTTWMSGAKLSTPYTPLTESDTRYQFSYSGQDVWKQNAIHKNKYKVNKNGTMKNKPNPQRN